MTLRCPRCNFFLTPGLLLDDFLKVVEPTSLHGGHDLSPELLIPAKILSFTLPTQSRLILPIIR